MESSKDRWLNYFISRRNSRREDMRHYMTLWIATLIALMVYLLSVYSGLFSCQRIVAAIIAVVVLGAAFTYFILEYKHAEKQVKFFSDAVELTLVNEPQTDVEYRKLYYLCELGKYQVRTDLWVFVFKQNYLYNIFLQKRANRNFFEKHEVPLLRECYLTPEAVLKSLRNTFPNH